MTFQHLFKEYIYYALALPVGFSIGAGLPFIYLWRWEKRLWHTIELRTARTLSRWQKCRTLLAGLFFICLGLVILGIGFFADIGVRGTLLNTWTLGFVAVCILVTLLCAFLMIGSLQRSDRKLEKRHPAPAENPPWSRPQPKEAREE